MDFCFQQKRQKIEAVIDRLICDLKQWQRHLYDELVLWADGKEPDPDSGIYGSLCIRGFAYQDDNGRWMLPEWIRDRVKENGGNSVDPQTLEVVRLVGTLLAPLISSGFQGFTGALAKDLENRVWELVRKVPDAADASERKEIKENPGGHDERVGELLGKVAEKYPRQAEAVVWEKSFRQLLENYSSQQPEVGDQFWLVLRRLLRNRDFFTIPEVKQKLIPALGYHPDMWGPSFDEIINGFVGDIRANRELNKLIKEIHHMKPWLFQ